VRRPALLAPAAAAPGDCLRTAFGGVTVAGVSSERGGVSVPERVLPEASEPFDLEFLSASSLFFFFFFGFASSTSSGMTLLLFTALVEPGAA